MNVCVSKKPITYFINLKKGMKWSQCVSKPTYQGKRKRNQAGWKQESSFCEVNVHIKSTRNTKLT